MNAFYKVKADYWDGNKELSGVVVGNDEGDIMNKIMAFYGRENVEQVSFWFSEFYEDDVIEVESFKDCPLFDFNIKT